MSKPKLMVLCIDALCDTDIAYMKTLPHFGWMLENGSLVQQVEPVYPALTYPCHVSILTGVYPCRHGIPHNEMVEPGVAHPPWYRLRRDVKAKYFLDYAKEHGYTTCALNWPLTGGAEFDLNMPMILPFGYEGDALPFYEGYATEELLDRYYWKYGWLLPNTKVSLDLYTMMLALDIIRDYNQPDVMLVKLCDLDSVRHDQGVDTPSARRCLAWHDAQFGALLESVRRYGDIDHTNFVVLGDHGQTDVERVLNFNRVLREHGLLSLDADGRLADYDAYCHSAGMSGWIQLKNPDDAATYNRVHQLLMSIKGDPRYAIDFVFTKAEAVEQFGLTGPFDFIIESTQPVSFGYVLADELFVKASPGDYKTAMATHGGLPQREHQTTLFACGPSVRRGAVVERGRLVDEAPTMAHMLGFDMPDVDGRVIKEIVKD